MRSLDSSAQPRLGKALGDLLGDALDARPARRRAMSGSPHFGHVSGSGSEKPQWWQFEPLRKRCSTSQAVHFGHSKRWPHFRHSVSGA